MCLIKEMSIAAELMFTRKLRIRMPWNYTAKNLAGLTKENDISNHLPGQSERRAFALSVSGHLCAGVPVLAPESVVASPGPIVIRAACHLGTRRGGGGAALLEALRTGSEHEPNSGPKVGPQSTSQSWDFHDHRCNRHGLTPRSRSLSIK